VLISETCSAESIFHDVGQCQQQMLLEPTNSEEYLPRICLGRLCESALAMRLPDTIDT
jgi:hypothetical protein